jgi:hypothetical protein
MPVSSNWPTKNRLGEGRENFQKTVTFKTLHFTSQTMDLSSNKTPFSFDC